MRALRRNRHDILGMAGELDDRWPSCASDWAGGKSGHHFVSESGSV